MDEAEIAVGGFVISGSEPPGVLELVEAALDHVSQGVDGGIDRDLDEAVPLGRECQDFRVWAGIMGKKESQYASTQRTCDPQ